MNEFQQVADIGNHISCSQFLNIITSYMEKRLLSAPDRVINQVQASYEEEIVEKIQKLLPFHTPSPHIRITSFNASSTAVFQMNPPTVDQYALANEVCMLLKCYPIEIHSR